jgi:acyl-CoA synthetase (AMP-forming)/AMP-acid ligase II
MIRSPHADVAIPDASLTEYVLEHAAAYGDKAAIGCAVTGQSYTYRTLAHAVNQAAAGLYGLGVRKGEVVGLVSANSPDFAVAFLALAQIGAVVSTVNPAATPDDIAAQFRDSSAVLVVTTPALVEKCEHVLPLADGVRCIVVLGESDRHVTFAQLLATTAPPPAVMIDAATDLVALPYSSGTSGLPKGVMLTHRNLVANLCQTFGPGSALGFDDRILAVLPFYHIYGLVVIMQGALRLGATIVTLPRFELEQFLHTIQSQRISYVNLVPPIVVALAKHPMVEQYDLSSLHHIHCGAAPLGESVARACSERTGAIVRQGYGLTETSPVTHNHPHFGDDVKFGSVGPPLANTACRVVDVVTGEDVARGTPGELLVRGPQVMRGYLNRPDETRAAISADDWFRTGDVVVADEDGWFTIVDRVKELIKFNGMQVAPAELESLLLSHPSIADAAVIPCDDEAAGEIPKAFIVTRAPLTAAEVMAFVAERVAPYKKVRAVEFVDDIPKSPSGKILRRVLVSRERAARTAPIASPSLPDN